MNAATAVHACPRCQLRFGQPVELADHLRRDHPVEVEEYPAPQGRVVLAVDPARPDPGVAVGIATTLAVQIGAAIEVVAAAAPGLGDATTQAYLRERTRECRQDGAEWVSWHDLGSRPPADAVIAHAGGTPSTWICLASRTRTAVGELVFGSVTSEVLEATDLPVVVIGPHAVDAREPFSRVVACVDQSRGSGVVAAGAAFLADRLGVRLVLLEVSLPTIDGDPLRDDRHLRTLARRLDREVDTVRLPGYREWQPILDFARGDPTTILVTGRRPPSAAGRFVAGSVAINLARRSHGPLMIVPSARGAA